MEKTLLSPKIKDIIDAFSLFESWQDRYAYIIELGEDMPPFPEEERRVENKVSGCVSQVWMVHKLDAENRFIFLGDSDSYLVKGLMAIVFEFYSHKTPQHILASQEEIKHILAQLRLEEGLTPQRSNGLQALLKAIHHVAANYCH